MLAFNKKIGSCVDFNVARVSMSGVSVRYPVPNFSSSNVFFGSVETPSGLIVESGRTVSVEALKAINLDITHGTRLGLLGANGAGKTTLLRTIAGIYEPTAGRIRTIGRVGSMLDIHSGFDINESGFDNIFLRAMFMGIAKEVVEQKVEGVADFSGLGQYLHMPLFSYSSGMKARLSFAIATGFDADIVVMDEWLSAGDTSFKKQAETRLTNYVEQAGILIMASHSHVMLERVCDRGVVIDCGAVIFDGEIAKAINFHKSMS